MGERQQVRETLYSYGYLGDAINMTVPQAVEWLRGMLDKIPAEYRDDSTFHLEFEGGYYDESARLIFDIYYDRPETDEELAKRERDHSAYYERQRLEQEARDRRELERLKAKYGA